MRRARREPTVVCRRRCPVEISTCGFPHDLAGGTMPFPLELWVATRSNGGTASRSAADCFCRKASPHERPEETAQAHARQLPCPRRRAVGGARRRRLRVAGAG